MIRLPLLLVLSVAVIGCGSAKPDPQVAELKKQIAALSARVDQLETTGLQIDTAEATQFGDVVADRLFVKTIMVVDENSKPRICLTSDTMIESAFRRMATNPSILLETSNSFSANLTMTNANGKLVTNLLAGPPGGSVYISSDDEQLGGLQLHSGVSGPEIRQLQKPGAGGWINLKQIPVDNNDTDYR